VAFPLSQSCTLFLAVKCRRRVALIGVALTIAVCLHAEPIAQLKPNNYVNDLPVFLIGRRSRALTTFAGRWTRRRTPRLPSSP